MKPWLVLVIFEIILTGLNTHLTTYPVQLGFLWEFELLKLKTCSLYHEKQKFKVISSQVLDNFFQPLTSWRLSEAVSMV